MKTLPYERKQPTKRSRDEIEQGNSSKGRPDLKVLKQRGCESTKYIDVTVLEGLGILSEVEEILSGVGWADLMNMKDPTYPELVYEFLSSFEFQKDAGGNHIFKFKVGNKPKKLPIASVREMFSWPSAGLVKFSKQDLTTVWHELTGSHNFKAGHVACTLIKSPTYRFLNRLMASNLYGRGGSKEKVTKSDLLLLYCFHRRVKADFAYLLGMRLEEVAKASSGLIMCGGFITRIAMVSKVFTKTKHEGRKLEPEFIDRTMLVNMGIAKVDKVTQELVLIGQGRRVEDEVMEALVVNSGSAIQSFKDGEPDMEAPIDIAQFVKATNERQEQMEKEVQELKAQLAAVQKKSEVMQNTIDDMTHKHTKLEEELQVLRQAQPSSV